MASLQDPTLANRPGYQPLRSLVGSIAASRLVQRLRRRLNPWPRAWLAIVVLLPTGPATAIVVYRFTTGTQPVHWGLWVGWGAPVMTGTLAMLAGLGIARGANLRTVLVVVTLVGGASYGTDIAASYVATGGYPVIARIIWPAIPLTVATWTVLPLYVVSRSPLGADRPILPVRLARRAFGGSWRSGRMLVGVWIPALLVAIAGLVRDFMFAAGRTTGPAWRGYTEVERWPYVGTAVWASACFLAVAILLAWWLVSTHESPPGDNGRQTVLSISSAVIAYFVVLLYGAAFGLWPEPVMDALMTPSIAVAGALLLVEEQSSEPIPSGTAWMTVGALIYGVVITAACWAAGATPLAASIIVGASGMTVPVLPGFLRGASSDGTGSARRRRTTRALDSISVGCPLTADAEAFRKVVRRHGVTGADLGRLLGSAWPGRQLADGGQARLEELLDSPIVRQVWPHPEDRAHQLRRLLALTALAHRVDIPSGSARHPSPAELLVCVLCEVDPRVMRLLPVPAKDLEYLVWRYRVWKLGADLLDGPFTWPITATYKLDELRATFRSAPVPKLPDRRADITPRDSKTTCRKYYDSALPRELEAIVARWRGE